MKENGSKVKRDRTQRRKPAAPSSQGSLSAPSESHSGHKTEPYDSQCSLKLAPGSLNPRWSNRQLFKQC